LAYFIGKRHYPIDYNVQRLGIYLLFTLVLLAIGWNIKFSSNLITQGFKEIPILIFALVAFLSERKKLKLSSN